MPEIAGISNISGLANNIMNTINSAAAPEGVKSVQGLDRLSSMLSGGEVSMEGDAFKDILNEMLSSEQMNNLSTDQLMSGDINGLVTAMVDMAESDLALQFTMQVRNKIIDAYKEIMSMQI